MVWEMREKVKRLQIKKPIFLKTRKTNSKKKICISC
jgi:hypothetical protein